MAENETPTANMFVCNGCVERWTGLTACHCDGCHRTFTGLTAFDRHRRGGECQPPSDVGLVPLARGWTGWGQPGRDERWAAA